MTKLRKKNGSSGKVSTRIAALIEQYEKNEVAEYQALQAIKQALTERDQAQIARHARTILERQREKLQILDTLRPLVRRWPAIFRQHSQWVLYRFLLPYHPSVRELF